MAIIVNTKTLMFTSKIEDINLLMVFMKYLVLLIKKLKKISKVAIELNKTPKIMIQIKLLDDPDKGGMCREDLLSNFDDLSA